MWDKERKSNREEKNESTVFDSFIFNAAGDSNSLQHTPPLEAHVVFHHMMGLKAGLSDTAGHSRGSGPWIAAS